MRSPRSPLPPSEPSGHLLKAAGPLIASEKRGDPIKLLQARYSLGATRDDIAAIIEKSQRPLSVKIVGQNQHIEFGQARAMYPLKQTTPPAVRCGIGERAVQRVRRIVPSVGEVRYRDQLKLGRKLETIPALQPGRTVSKVENWRVSSRLKISSPNA